MISIECASFSRVSSLFNSTPLRFSIKKLVKTMVNSVLVLLASRVSVAILPIEAQVKKRSPSLAHVKLFSSRRRKKSSDETTSDALQRRGMVHHSLRYGTMSPNRNTCVLYEIGASFDVFL